MTETPDALPSPDDSDMPEGTVDVLLIGGGIMSATLGTLLQELQPTWKIAVFERLQTQAVSARSPRPWPTARPLEAENRPQEFG